ncbi:MAG: CRTAC1 family protein [Verrucomicrobiales bacterium]|nr:CRTAC1 family protein [Verrucomicrobiales bacterium]
MDGLLAKIREVDLVEHHFFGKKGILDLEKKLEAGGGLLGPRERFETRSLLGMAYLNYGEIARGIETLEGVYRGVKQMGAPDGIRAKAAFDLGLAYFRLAETENCCAVNAPESCILPLRGAAIHSKRRGSEMALKYFLEAAEVGQEDRKVLLASTWFLNLAAMTLGEHPSAVVEALRLPEKLFTEEGESPKFRNVAAERGVDWQSLAGGVLAEDFDGDGDLDLVVSSWDSAESMRYYENRGADGGFVERSEEAGFSRTLGGLHLVQADYDNDGDVDFLVLRGAWLMGRGKHPNSLMRNEGGGVFCDVTFESGIGDEHWPTQTAAWADYDNDGDVDLYVGNETAGGIQAPCQLFRNEGNGTFVDVAEEAGVTNMRWAKGVAWGDFDGDQFPDLVVSNYEGANRFYRNLRDGRFEDVAGETGTTLPLKSFPVWTWDSNNDGSLDFFVSSYSGNVATYVLYSQGGQAKGMDFTGHYRGDGSGRFENVAISEGLTAPMATMGSSFGDLDNDGWLDFYLGTGEPNIAVVLPNQLFMNQGGAGFKERTMASGLGHLQKGHAVAFADFDEDGDLDVFEQMGGASRVDEFRDALYENGGKPDTHWIKVQLVGTESNRSGIGARICVRVRGRDGEKRSIYRWVGGGSSFGGNPLRQHVGIGGAEEVELLEVYWPTSDLTDTFLGVGVDRTVVVTEGERELGEVVASPWSLVPSQ